MKWKQILVCWEWRRRVINIEREGEGVINTTKEI